MRARKTAFLHIIFTSNQTPFLGVLSSRSIERYRGNFPKVIQYDSQHSKSVKLSKGHSCSIIKPLKMMKNYLKKHLARKNNTLVKNSFMVSITCVIEKTGKKFHNTAFVCFFSPRKQKNILCGFYNAVALPGDCHVALLLAMTLSALHGIKNTLIKKQPSGC